MEAHLLNYRYTMAQPYLFIIATLVLCSAVSDGIDILARARRDTRSTRINLLPELPLSDDDGGPWYETISERDRFCKFLSSRYILAAVKLLYSSLRNAFRHFSRDVHTT